jgi:hypothetical protein
MTAADTGGMAPPDAERFVQMREFAESVAA